MTDLYSPSIHVCPNSYFDFSNKLSYEMFFSKVVGIAALFMTVGVRAADYYINPETVPITTRGPSLPPIIPCLYTDGNRQVVQ